MMPESKTGKSMISEGGLLVKDLNGMPGPKKRSIRIMPPVFSDFQAIMSDKGTMKVGKL